MSRRLFGTDGVRGVANRTLLPETAFSLGLAAGRWLAEAGLPPVVAVCRDTRTSGPMLEAALSAGLAAAGASAERLGVAPTPAASWAVRRGLATLGAVVSASHNPAPDNGIKFFGPDGGKLADDAEARLESFLAEPEFDRPTGGGVGTIRDSDAVGDYEDWLVSLLPERLDGVRIAVDAANGAAYAIGPRVLRRLGAELVETGVEPGDGTAINAQGGATKPDTVQRLTVETGATLGIAFDGDADRVVFSDDRGRLINGDRVIGAWAVERKGREGLDPALVVGTVMSNGGYEAYLTAQGVGLERAPVGDKYVMRRIAETGALVGGEQSGHLIFPEFGPTGDGIVSALQFLRLLRRSGRTAAEVVDDYAAWPQAMVNLAVASKEGWGGLLEDAMAAADERLRGRGRLSVRPSGTQPVLRIMVEADDAALRDEVLDAVVAVAVERLGGHVEGRVDLTHSLGD